MKKILAFILAALTVFSTVGFAAPTVEVTENSEETAQFEETAAQLSEEETADYYSALYGIKDWFYDASSDANAETEEDSGVKYISVNASSRRGTRTTELSTGRIYTYIEKFKSTDSDEIKLRVNSGAFMDDGCFLNKKNGIKFNANVWNEYINSFKLTESEKAKITELTYPDAFHNKRPFSLAYNGLYYKPAAEAEAKVESRNGNVVTVSYPGGVESEAAKALSTYYEEYFGGKVKAVSVGETEITLTLSDANIENVVIPALVNADKTATYNEVDLTFSVDRFALYGIKDWFYDASSDANAETEEDSGVKYISVNASSRRGTRTTELSTGRIYTYIEKFKSTDSDEIKLRVNSGAFMDDGCFLNKKNGIKFNANVWNEYINSFELTESEKAKITEKIYPDAFHGKNPFSLAYNGLYYKPAAEAATPVVTVISKTSVTVEYPDGIYAETAKALETYYKEYFGGNAEMLEINNNTVSLTLASGATEFEIPSLVSMDGTKTSAAVTISADIFPTTIDEVDYSDRHSGIRFKASVTAEQKGRAVEYGWIVARKKTLGDRELTFALDNSNGKTFVSAIAFGKTTDNKVIDKWLTNDGSTIVFSGVVTNIPKGMEDDIIVARPYIKYTESDVFYGTAKESALSAVKA